MVGIVLTHTPNLALSRFLVKVVRHKQLDSCCGGLWKNGCWRRGVFVENVLFVPGFPIRPERFVTVGLTAMGTSKCQFLEVSVV